MANIPNLKTNKTFVPEVKKKVGKYSDIAIAIQSLCMK